MNQNRVAIITGSAQRIGACIAEHLHQAGYDVLIHYNTSAKAACSLATKLNNLRENSAAVFQLNLQDTKQLPELINAATDKWQRLDLLVNNASSFYPTPVGDFSDTAWHDLMSSNLQAPIFLAQAAAPFLAAQRGNIINLIDIHAWKPLREHTIYCTAKAGLAMATKSLAKELAPNVRVNGIAPGPILWPNDVTHDLQQQIIDSTLLKRKGEAEEIADAVLFLANTATYTTGHIFPVDGGRHL
jgi:pteridine reductase